MLTNFEAIGTLARSQHGLVTTAQLHAAGFSEMRIRRLVGRGMLERVRRSVYVTAGVPKTWPQALMATVLRGGEGAIASHTSAARLWDFRFAPDDGFELTVSRDHATTVDGVRIHRSKILTPADISVRSGIPCTSYVRTLCDLTTQLSWLQSGKVLDDGLRRKVLTLDDVRASVQRLDSGPYRRLTVVQALLEKRSRPGYDPGDSDAEGRLFEVLETAGLPLPVQQHPVKVRGRTYYLDYSWPQFRVYLEWYGLPWHIGASAVVYDSARVSALASVKWRPLIFTDESTDREIVELTRDALS